MASSQCCENPPTVNPSSGGGSVVGDLGGFPAYVSGVADSKRAVLLVSDIFGFEAPILRQIADKIAAAGFFVVVPDFFGGDPFVAENTERPLPVWLQSHTPEKGLENAKLIVAALKAKGVSAVGAGGFCWGAKVVLGLATSGDIQAGVVLHPSFVTVDDFKGVKSAIAVLGAENDHASPPSLVKQFEKILSSKPEVPSVVKIFPAVSHGWTVRYDINDIAAVKSAEEAHRDMLDWFVKYMN